MQIEYKSIFATVTNRKAIKKAIERQKFIGIVNNESILTHIDGNHYQIKGKNALDSMELMVMIPHDCVVSINSEGSLPVLQALETMRPSIFIGEFHPMDLVRYSIDNMYSIAEQVLNYEYEILDMNLKFGNIQEDGSIEVYATINMFRTKL
jgi:hypothetical protein